MFIIRDLSPIWALLFGTSCNGAGAAFAFVGSLNGIGKWFLPKQFTFMAAMAETIGMSGTLLGRFFLADLVQHMGWRNSMTGAAGIIAVIAGVIGLVVRDAPPGVVAVSTEQPEGSLRQDLYLL